MTARVFLGLSALLWIPYGIACALHPAMLSESAGIVATTATGTTELRAMYGGLQVGIGVLSLFGAVRQEYARFALIPLGILCGGLAAARLAGIVFDGGVSGYTTGALLFEVAIVGMVAWLLRGQAEEATATP